MADPRATLGGAVLRACVWALGGRCERAALAGAGRGRWHVAMVPRGRRRWRRVTIQAESVAAAARRLLRATRAAERQRPRQGGEW
ncbi:MAG TPA: hypothetical protein VF310_12315 [Vicinamibacteria bacterium]